jgi:hypothetical protein
MRRYRLPRTWSKSGGWRRRLPAVITSEVRLSTPKADVQIRCPTALLFGHRLADGCFGTSGLQARNSIHGAPHAPPGR